MRHYFVLTMAALMIAASAVGVKADNQAAAEKIAATVSEQFPNDDITIQFQDGKVWLRGQMKSDSDIMKMIQFISEQDGVTTIENELTTTQPAGVIAPASANMPRLMSENNTVPTVVQTNQVVRVPNKNVVVVRPRVPARTQVVYAQPKAAPIPVNVTRSKNQINQVAGHRILRAPQETIVGSDVVYVDGNGGGNHVGTQPALAVGAQTRGPQDFMVEQNGSQMTVVGGCQPNLPSYAWPSYAAHPNYAQVTYPKKYAAGTWPNMGPFYPYPNPPAEWRKVTLEWHDGNWWMDFDDGSAKGPFSPLFREPVRYGR